MPHAVRHGAAVIALTIDEQGMAKTAERKLEVARAIHELCVGEYGMDPGSLMFDALTFTLATGQQDRKCVAHQRHGNAPPESPGLAEDILAASARGQEEWVEQ